MKGESKRGNGTLYTWWSGSKHCHASCHHWCLCLFYLNAIHYLILAWQVNVGFFDRNSGKVQGAVFFFFYMFALYVYGEHREKKACQIDTDESSSENVTEPPEVRWVRRHVTSLTGMTQITENKVEIKSSLSFSRRWQWEETGRRTRCLVRCAHAPWDTFSQSSRSQISPGRFTGISRHPQRGGRPNDGGDLWKNQAASVLLNWSVLFCRAHKNVLLLRESLVHMPGRPH